MSNKKYDLAVIVGRVEPFHYGHAYLLKKAYEVAERTLMILGSSNKPRSIKNPFSTQERIDMVEKFLQSQDWYEKNVMHFTGISDHPSDEAWAEEIQTQVMKMIRIYGLPDDAKVCVIGHKKDNSSFYLDMFPQWAFEEIPNVKGLNATDVREILFNENMFALETKLKLEEVVPPIVFAYLQKFALTDEYKQLVKEWKHIRDYKESWTVAPFAPTFVTVDAVVIQSGHILICQRKKEPGKGLFCLPGGFLEPNERIVDSMLRELREETKIKVPEPVLRGNIKNSAVFDDPARSLRGRSITHAFLIELNPGPLPKIKGSDDIRMCQWVPLSTFAEMESMMFEDHFAIVTQLRGGKQ